MTQKKAVRADALDWLIAYVEDADCCYGSSCQLGEIEQRLNVLAPKYATLLAALKAVVANHCGNEKVFCSTCSPARAVIAEVERENWNSK